MHALRAKAGSSKQHRDRTARVLGDRGCHHVLSARREISHLDNQIDQRLPGVDHSWSVRIPRQSVIGLGTAAHADSLSRGILGPTSRKRETGTSR